ncbi:MAG: DUF1854 domain-containing protein [Kiritimatiellia bacterium]
MSTTRFLNPENCAVSRGKAGYLQVQIENGPGCPQAVFRRLFPIRMPSSYISVGDKNGKELGIIEDLSDFDTRTRRMIEKELDFFYAVPVIIDILDIREEYGYYYWQTVTDRGRRDFYVKGRADNVRSRRRRRSGNIKVHSEGSVFITDINNCRYRIPDVSALNPAGRALLDRVL